jgi:hypothetical protein
LAVNGNFESFLPTVAKKQSQFALLGEQVTPHEKIAAQLALNQLENSVYKVLSSDTRGFRTGEVARLLGIESNCPTPNANWLARCILENLVEQGRAISEKEGGARLFRALYPHNKRLAGVVHSRLTYQYTSTLNAKRHPAAHC